MFFGDILSIENVCLDIRGNLLTLNSSVLIIGYSLNLVIFFMYFLCRQKSTIKRAQCKFTYELPSESALFKVPKFVPASGSKLACTRNERKLDCARHNASLLAVSNMSCCKVFGADYRAFSQLNYIFYVLSMPIESTKELCAYGRFLNGKRS